ncbi:hypothetical protein NEOC65_000480 [Neochlamydia sp. AcF65]|nr:hypothetical protein [Neochlamydia sp. AcF65]
MDTFSAYAKQAVFFTFFCCYQLSPSSPAF